jgi:dienelactone hydrolase
MKSDIGNLYEMIQKQADASSFELSFLSRQWSDIEKWRITARAKLHELLHYDPEGAPLNAEVLSIEEKDGYKQEEVEFNTSKHVRIRGTLLIPTQIKGPFPCIIALHSHDGFYYFGREKILETENELAVLSELKQRYGGRSWGSCLARRGYAIFMIDAYYFGTRKLDLSTVSEDMMRRCPFKLKDGMTETEYIRTYNQACGFFEQLLVRHILAAGLTWPGIMLHDDRKSIDYVLTRPEIDPERIGCCGLSVGAFRSVYLAALDPRVKCASATGFMVSYGSGLFNRYRDHTFMVYVPGLYRYMDMPDVAGLAVPTPFLIQQCRRDQLFTCDGMKSAEDKLKAIYKKAGAEDKIVCTWYDVPHSFNVEMQEEAFTWFDKWLKA